MPPSSPLKTVFNGFAFHSLISIRQDLRSGISLSQRKYVLDLLHESGQLACRPASTPIEANHHLADSEGELLSYIDQCPDCNASRCQCPVVNVFLVGFFVFS